MDDIRIVGMVSNFPIGDASKNRSELLSKAELIAHLSKYQEQFEMLELEEREASVKKFLGEVLALEDGEMIPDLNTAERTLKLSPGFIQDYGKIQFIKENNPGFNATFDTISNAMELTEKQTKTMR